jgi:seryl-tRNA synthetase
MKTFKQYIVDEMGSDAAVGFRSRRTGMFSHNKAEREIKPIIQNAERLLRRRDRISPEALQIKANQLLGDLVDTYEKMGDEVTDLKARIADKYTQVKRLLQSPVQTVEDCVQMLEQVVDLLHG